MGTIYRATNTVNGKMYIGQTKRKLSYRIREHINLAGKEQPRLLVHRAIQKYGSDNFIWVVLEECDESVLDDREIFYIEYHNTLAPFGYNLASGGVTNFGASGEFHYISQMSDDEREIWSKQYRLGSNNPNYGNGAAIAGDRHFLNQMSDKQKQQWLDDNIRGDNNYQKTLTKEQLKDKCWVNTISEDEKEEWKQKLKGGPWKKIKESNPERYKELCANVGKRSVGVVAHAKEYIITFPDATEYRIRNLAQFCRSVEGYTLRPSSLTKCSQGKYTNHQGFKCRYFNADTDHVIEQYNKEY